MSTILAVAGEASGDRLLAPVVARLRAAGHAVCGLGGDEAIAAGLDPVAHARDVAGHGLVEAARVVPATIRTVARLRRIRADAILVVDCPEIGRRLLDGARCPVAWVAPPQAWAWRPWRARGMRRAAWVGCLFAFACDWYRQRGVAAEWIGHPLADHPPPPPAPEPRVALLPGSRQSAVEALLPIMLGALARLGLPGVLPIAQTADRGRITRLVRASGLPVQLVDAAEDALAAARVVLAGAGTSTLQATLAGRPCVTLARLHPATWAVARRLVRVDAVALPNLILGRRAFPECLQAGCTPDAVAAAAEGALARDWGAELAAVRAGVARPGGADRVMAALTRALAGAADRPIGWPTSR